MKNRKLASLVSYILALFLTFTLFATTVCTVFLLTVANPKRIDNAILKSEYIKPLKDEIAYKWDNLAAICGMEERDELLALLTEERIENDSREYFKKAYSGETIDTSALKETVHKVVSDYAYKNDWGLISKAELEQNINDLVNSCIDEYNLSVKVRLIPKLLSTVTKFKKFAAIGLTGSAILSLGIMVFIFFLQHNRRKTAFYAFTAFGANAFLYLFMVLFVLSGDLIDRIPIEASALYNLVNGYLQNIFTLVIISTILLLILSALSLILYLKPQKNKDTFRVVP